MEYGALIALPTLRAESPPFLLFHDGHDQRLGLAGGHDYDALCVPHWLRSAPSPQPVGAGSFVPAHELPCTRPLAVHGVHDHVILLAGVSAQTNRSPTFRLAPCGLTAVAPAGVAANADSLAWVNTLRATQRGVQFWKGPSGFLVSTGNRGFLPAGCISRTECGLRPCDVPPVRLSSPMRRPRARSRSRGRH